ncbi:MAG: hypothetical protein NVSMB18_06440 [Acetobacteraceae bacterium]
MARKPIARDPIQPTKLAPARGIADEPRDVPTPAEHEQKRREVAAAFAAGGPSTGGGGTGGGATGRGGTGGGGTGGGGNGGGGPPTPPPPRGTADSPVVVALTRPDDPSFEQYEVALWDVIAATSKATSFSVYSDFLDAFFDHRSATDRDNTYWETKRNSAVRRPVSPYGLDAWDLVTTATDIFVKHQAGALSDVTWLATQKHFGKAHVSPPFVDTGKAKFEDALAAQIGKNPNLSTYLELVRRKLAELPTLDFFSLSTDRSGIFIDRIESPLLVELIWSYWMEQGMLVQTMNAIALRFQNAVSPELANPLRNLATDPLRPLSNLLWGYVQTEGGRLPIARRVYEYAHAYGLDLVGKAVPAMNVVESRLGFLEAFHTLLQAALAFYKEHDDLTVKADGFPLLNLLTEVHTLLAKGADNQFNDLPWTARSEMMSMQWLLARPEFREFLGGRIMVPYPEPWMDRVDSMKSLQGWTDTSITAFYWLATYSEQILLSIRYGNWSMITDGALAAHWAERWRYAVQSYAHYYRQVTGVDLAVQPADMRDGAQRFRQPSLLIGERATQRQPPRVTGPASRPALPAPAPTVQMPPVRRPATLPPRNG